MLMKLLGMGQTGERYLIFKCNSDGDTRTSVHRLEVEGFQGIRDVQ